MTPRAAPLFDDTYTGPRWRYGLTYRPVSFANLPSGWIVKSDRKHPNFKKFGTIDFPRQLAEHEIKSFEPVLCQEGDG